MCDAVRALQKDKHTIRRWVGRFLEEGVQGLRDLPRSGAPRTFQTTQRSLLVETSLTSPQELGLPFATWTRQRLRDYLLEQHQLEISVTRIGELLHEEGLRWKTQEAWFTEKLDPSFAEKRGPSSGYTSVRQKRPSSSV
jgi:transposase